MPRKDLPRRNEAEWLKVPALPANKDLWQGLGCASESSYDEDFLSSGLEQGPLNLLQPCLGKVEATGKGFSLRREDGAWPGLG